MKKTAVKQMVAKKTSTKMMAPKKKGMAGKKAC